MFEIETSGRLGADPWEKIDGDHAPVVWAWLLCGAGGEGAWVKLVVERPTECAVLSGLRKDDFVTVSGEARGLKVSDDGQPFIELVIHSIVPWRHMAEADQGLAVH